MFIQAIDCHSPWAFVAACPKEWPLVFLDSAQRHDQRGRYSYIGVDPVATLTYDDASLQILADGQVDILSEPPIQALREAWRRYRCPVTDKKMPFQGGLMGYLSYDLFRYIEPSVPIQAERDHGFPDYWFGVFDVVICFDHVAKRSSIFSSGLRADGTYCDHRAKKRMAQMLIYAGQQQQSVSLVPYCDVVDGMQQGDYEHAVRRAQEYILNGDIFEVNMTQRFEAAWPDDLSPTLLYAALRQRNPAPFSAFIRWGDHHILSSSPERFLECRDSTVETRPIKGTRPRQANSIADKRIQRELLESRKDRAENTMIVDLMRHDLSRVCRPGSIAIPQLCALETYETVHHLVSAVTGQLREENDVFDLLEATFPGGSITGAPKVRAMGIIEELEPTARGPYCGSIGYMGWDGDMDLSIVIRSYTLYQQKLRFQAGGAVVLGSDPQEEYQESLDKAYALKDLLCRNAS